MSLARVPFYSGFGSDNFIWFSAILLSLSVHYLFFFYKDRIYNAAPAIVIQETITQVRFSNIAPPPLVAIEAAVEAPAEIIKQEPVIQPEVIPVIEKIEEKVEPEIKPKPKPKPKTKPQEKPKLKQIKPRKKPVKISKTPVKQQLESNAKVAKVSPIRAEKEQKLIEQTRKNYEALLRRHIEVHKSYPRIARKRRIEGKILVSFTLLADGSINNLLVNGKKSILIKASKKAIDYALPMPQPPKKLSLPIEIKFYMDYLLK